MTCSICGYEYDGFGNDAFPFEGRCCTDCDNRWVTPARILRAGPGNELLPVLRRFAQLGAFHSRAHADLLRMRAAEEAQED